VDDHDLNLINNSFDIIYPEGQKHILDNKEEFYINPKLSQKKKDNLNNTLNTDSSFSLQEMPNQPQDLYQVDNENLIQPQNIFQVDNDNFNQPEEYFEYFGDEESPKYKKTDWFDNTAEEKPILKESPKSSPKQEEKPILKESPPKQEPKQESENNQDFVTSYLEVSEEDINKGKYKKKYINSMNKPQLTYELKNKFNIDLDQSMTNTYAKNLLINKLKDKKFVWVLNK
jgi:hypothetical protein